MSKLMNLARMSTGTTGTGAITLGSAVSGCLSFAVAAAAAGVSSGDTITYGIEDGDQSEVGRGVWTSPSTLTRAEILASTNGGSAISLSGSAEVFCVAAAQDIRFSGAIAKKSVDQTLANYTVATAVALDAEDFDTDNWHSNVTFNTRMTVPAGLGIEYVQVWGTVVTSSDTTATWGIIYFQKNGNTAFQYGNQMVEITTVAKNLSTSALIPAVAGDYIEMFFLEESDTSVTIESESTRFSIMAAR